MTTELNQPQQKPGTPVVNTIMREFERQARAQVESLRDAWEIAASAEASEKTLLVERDALRAQLDSKAKCAACGCSTLVPADAKTDAVDIAELRAQLEAAQRGAAAMRDALVKSHEGQTHSSECSRYEDCDFAADDGTECDQHEGGCPKCDCYFEDECKRYEAALASDAGRDFVPCAELERYREVVAKQEAAFGEMVADRDSWRDQCEDARDEAVKQGAQVARLTEALERAKAAHVAHLKALGSERVCTCTMCGILDAALSPAPAEGKRREELAPCGCCDRGPCLAHAAEGEWPAPPAGWKPVEGRDAVRALAAKEPVKQKVTEWEKGAMVEFSALTAQPGLVEELDTILYEVRQCEGGELAMRAGHLLEKLRALKDQPVREFTEAQMRKFAAMAEHEGTCLFDDDQSGGAWRGVESSPSANASARINELLARVREEAKR